jgi:hypothetical protein
VNVVSVLKLIFLIVSFSFNFLVVCFTYWFCEIEWVFIFYKYDANRVFYAYDIYFIARQHEPPPSKCIDEGEEEAKMTDLRFRDGAEIVVGNTLTTITTYNYYHLVLNKH